MHRAQYHRAKCSLIVWNCTKKKNGSDEKKKKNTHTKNRMQIRLFSAIKTQLINYISGHLQRAAEIIAIILIFQQILVLHFSGPCELRNCVRIRIRLLGTAIGRDVAGIVSGGHRHGKLIIYFSFHRNE